MQNEKPNIICNDELEIVKITPDLYDQAVELYQKYFMKYENVSIATNLLSCQKSIDEMELLIRYILKDGVSFAAKHRKTQELVAFCVNKIINPATNCTFDALFRKLKTPAMQYVGQYLERMEGTYDLFKEWNVDCVFEIEFLSTRTDFGRKGIALTLSEFAIEYARKMLLGTLPASEDLPEHVRDLKPQVVCSVLTSRFSQRVGEKLCLESVNKIANTEFVYEGKTFAEKIDPIHEFSIFAAKRL